VMTIDPPVIVETYPNPLTNLYIGHQLIITGRYDTAVPVTVTFSGEAYGIQQEYIYNIDLADTVISQNQFLTKLWAKQKMEYLYVLYFTFDEESPEAEEIKNLIIDISICYNVISPFTNYTGGGGTTTVEEDAGTQPDAQRICRFYPNPFSTSGTFNLLVEEDYSGTAFLEIFDNTGKVVMILEIEINGQGNYEIRWDGKDNSGNPLKPGIYLFTVTFGDKSYSGKIFKM